MCRRLDQACGNDLRNKYMECTTRQTNCMVLYRRAIVKKWLGI